jgi:uncharacterized cupin superfamily protein
MEPQVDASVIHASSQAWQPDPDVPGSEMMELVRADGLWAGLSRFTSVDGPVTWTPAQREVAVVLEGSVRIEVQGRVLELAPGDLFSLTPGVETTWHITTPFKEAWVLGDRPDTRP